MFQSLKWTMEFCHIEGRGRANLDPRGIHAVSIELDQKKRLLVVHQGPDLTGADEALVEHQRLTNAYQGQISFVDDGDQLTRRWTAGDFRRLARRLASSSKIGEWYEVVVDNVASHAILSFPTGVVERRSFDLL